MMQYLGGKARIAKKIADYIKGELNGRYFIEPFCGALNITAAMNGIPRLASDSSPYLASLYQALRNGWEPPKVLTKEEFKQLKEIKDPNNPLTAFAGFGCSFNGIFFSNYAKNKYLGRSGNYAERAACSLMKKMKLCEDALIIKFDYRKLTPTPESYVYCDPPYAGTSWPNQEPFDHGEFWNKMRQWNSQGISVLISEYDAPDDFECVLEIPTPYRRTKGSIEKLFKCH